MPDFKQCLFSLRSVSFEYAVKFIATGAAHLFTAQVFTQVLSFAASVIVVRFLSPAELAESRIIQTYAGYIVVLGGMGLSASILSVFPKESNRGTRATWLRSLVGLTALTSSALALIAAALSWQGLLMSEPKTAFWFRWFLVGTVANVLAGLVTAFYQSERQVVRLSKIQSVVRLLNFLLVICAAWKAGFAGYLVALVAGSWVYLFSLYSASPTGQAAPRGIAFPGQILSVGLLLMGGNLLYSLSRSVDLVMLDRLLRDRSLLGSYALASSFMAFPQFILATLQSVGTPYFAARFREPGWLLRTTRNIQALAVALSLAVAAGVFLGFFALVRFYYGAAYAAAIGLMLPMLAAFCLSSTYHILAMAVFAIDRVRFNVLVAAIMFPVSVSLTFAGIRVFGVTGAVWAQVISAGLYALLEHVIGWRVLLHHRARICALIVPVPG